MNTELMTLEELNALSSAEFGLVLSSVFENAPWIARSVNPARPFTSLTALHAAMMAKIATLQGDEVSAFLNGHPRLSPETLRRGTSEESSDEQKSAGLDQIDAATNARLDALNEAYETRFGFPFILAVRNASLTTLLATFERRVTASIDAERAEAVAEISAISWMRLLDRLRPAPTGRLSTHVLDTARAAPAASLGVELRKHEYDGTIRRIGAYATDANGRFDTETANSIVLDSGIYEWCYDTPTYFARHGYATRARSHFGKISITFSVWNPEERYHIPMLLTPGAYTAYRGN